MTIRRLFVAVSLSTALPLGLAWGQGSPSADSIINSLKPGAGMMGGTRGIRPVSPGPAAAPAPAVEPAPVSARPAAPRVAAPAPMSQPAAAAAPAAPSVNLTVQFATNSAELTPAAVKTLSELGRALSSSTLASYRFRIEGHTDTVGGAEPNKALSERRAQAVVAFLSSKFNIAPSRLEPVGMGEEGLLVQTPPGTAEMRNRRVQVINLGA